MLGDVSDDVSCILAVVYADACGGTCGDGSVDVAEKSLSVAEAGDVRAETCCVEGLDLVAGEAGGEGGAAVSAEAAGAEIVVPCLNKVERWEAGKTLGESGGGGVGLGVGLALGEGGSPHDRGYLGARGAEGEYAHYECGSCLHFILGIINMYR